jgi:hypothetical protein
MMPSARRHIPLCCLWSPISLWTVSLLLMSHTFCRISLSYHGNHNEK